MESPARRFVDAIAAHDRAALRATLAPGVDFKGLTPRRFWEAASPDGVLDVVLGNWFEEQDQITAVLGVTEDLVADTGRIGYRFEVETPDGPYVVEQQAYHRTGPQGIEHLRIMCSGFRPRAD